MEKITEWMVQESLYRNLNEKKHRLIVPNCKALGYEADVLSLTRAGYITEFEIKLSRSDFLNESRCRSKKCKFQLYESAQNISISAYSAMFCPNFFYYVCPKEIIKPDQVPDFAGLLWIVDLKTAFFRVILEAPRLHGYKLAEPKIEWMIRSMQAKFWKDRKKYRS